MTWYDGGKLPPKELFQGEKLITHDGGSLVIGTKGTLFTRTWHGGETDVDRFLLLPRKQFEGVQMPAPTLPRTPSHHHEWASACLGKGTTLSPFSYASVLTESLLLGNVALRAGKTIQWDREAMRAIGCPEADAFIRTDAPGAAGACRARAGRLAPLARGGARPLASCGTFASLAREDFERERVSPRLRGEPLCVSAPPWRYTLRGSTAGRCWCRPRRARTPRARSRSPCDPR